MIFRPKRGPEDVAEWLVIATRDLVPYEQKRIWTEILTHHNDALARHQSDGLSEHEAQIAALADLGDVYEAQNRFRKMYLLEKEEKQLRGILSTNKPPSFLTAFLNIFVWVFAAYLTFLKFPNSTRCLKLVECCTLAMAFIVLIVFPSGSRIFSKSISVRGNIIFFKLVGWTGNFGMYFTLCLLRWQKSQVPLLYSILAFGILLFMWDFLRTIQALRKLPSNWPEPAKV